MRSGESFIEQRRDTRILLSKEFQTERRNAKKTGVRGRVKLSRRNVELQEVRQIRPTIVAYRFKGKEKQFVFNSLFNRKPVESVKDPRYMIRIAVRQISIITMIISHSSCMIGKGHHTDHHYASSLCAYYIREGGERMKE